MYLSFHKKIISSITVDIILKCCLTIKSAYQNEVRQATFTRTLYFFNRNDFIPIDESKRSVYMNAK